MNNGFFSQDVFEKNGIIFTGTFLYAFIGLAMQEYFGKLQLHLEINAHHNFFFDVFFKYYTVYSLPFFFTVAFMIIIWKYDYRMLFYLLSALILTTILVFYVKKTYFLHGHRPTEFFQNLGIDIHTVEGVKNSITYTYPSGHSANAFLIMLFFSMLYRTKKWLQFLCLILALLVVYSRIYLSKHFLIDTVGGTAVGLFCNVFTYYYIKKIRSPFLDKKIISQ